MLSLRRPALSIRSVLSSGLLFLALACWLALPAHFWTSLSLSAQATIIPTAFDFDGDGHADFSVWRAATNGNWHVLKSSDSTAMVQSDWGKNSTGDIAVPADYDGDGKTDVAFFRPSEGKWYIVKSTAPSNPVTLSWGMAGDVPVPGDYFDGDGKADLAIFRPSECNWYVSNSSNGVISIISWGASGDVPITGNYDGDNKTDIAVYRPSEGNWYIRESSTGVLIIQWGGYGDKLVPADYDGDGRTDMAVWRPTEGKWFIRKSSNSADVVIRQFGLSNSSDVPVAADYTGDGKADIAIYRPSDNNWYMVDSATGAESVQMFGFSSDDVAVPFVYVKTVPPPPTQAPTANVGGPYFAESLTVRFDGSQSSDVDGTIASYQWTFGDGQSFTGTATTGVKPTHTYSAAGTYNVSLTVTDNDGRSSSSVSTTVNIVDFTQAKLDPMNRAGTGGDDPLSRNFNWSLPILGLPGRAGLDLGLSLSYNSLVWLRSGSYIKFDIDEGMPAPGFRLSFPVIKPKYRNAQVNRDAYLLITPSGARLELRRAGTSNKYVSADSSYIELDDSASLVLRTTDGTQMFYGLYGKDYQCERIKDRNGNYIDINRDISTGRITSIVDTLARTIIFNYDVNNNLSSITQSWTLNGQQQTHTWATFSYADKTIQTNFTGLTVIGPQNNTTVKVLEKVTLDDGSYVKFNYSSWGQVDKVTRYAADSQQDSHPLSYSAYDLNPAAAQTDCPRFTERRDWAENWNGGAEVTTHYSIQTGVQWTMPDDASEQTGTVSRVTEPDGTYYKIYTHSSGWDKGLTLLTETYDSQDTLQRWATTHWTQDDTSLSYPLNPRAIGMNVGDPAGNRRRITVGYTSINLPNGAAVNLPQDTSEYDGASVIRHVQTDYVTGSTYLNRYLIGLVSEQRLYDREGNLAAKVSFEYDGANSLTDLSSVIQHDADYGISFGARGLLTTTRRWDVNYPADQSKSVANGATYYITGAVKTAADALGHQTTIGYTDSFSDNINRNTFAYPTSVTDAEGFSSTSSYNYDAGAVAKVRDPLGAEIVSEYDSIGRMKRRTLRDGVNNQDITYTRLEYSQSGTELKVYTLLDVVDSTNVESFLLQRFDGAGRVIGAATLHPGSVGQYSGQKTTYDVMGRVKEQYVPAEISNPLNLEVAQWALAGDDALLPWKKTVQSYDWKGRPTVTTNTDGTTRHLSYEGCGCAGGETVTTTDELGRTQKVYHDVLGRVKETQVLNMDAGQSVYSSVVNTYNARDQITNITQYAGAAAATTPHQETILSYDGHGRLKSRKIPAADAPTTYLYNEDDTLKKVEDARGATTTFTYYGRHLVKDITYGAPAASNITVPATVSYEYDAAGNRKKMTDGTGLVEYEYDNLSRLKWEKRTVSALASAQKSVFTLFYDYTRSGQLKSITDPFNSAVGYSYDQSGRLKQVGGSVFGGVTVYAKEMQYRAWGALKHLKYGDNPRTLDISYNSRLQVERFNIAGVMDKQYQYYEDGGLKRVQNMIQADTRFDRLYVYDRMGRVTSALTGIEANGGQSVDGIDRPYNESFQYDAMGHLTSRTTRYWNQSYDWAGSYLNDRNTSAGWQYDADGRILNNMDAGYTYDAAGRMDSIHTTESTGQTFDGDGQRVKTSECTFNEQSWQWDCVDKYYIRSSVLGGQVVSEIDAEGGKLRTYVYAGGSVLAWQTPGAAMYGTDSVTWEHRDASGQSVRATDVDGTLTTIEGADGQEIDPAGADAGMHAPLPPIPDEPRETLLDYPQLGRLSQPGVSYAIDGIPVSVSEFMDAVDSRFASPFDILSATLRGSTRSVGIRTITRWHEEWRIGIESPSQLIRQSISIEMLPIYESSSWSFFELYGHQQSENSVDLRPLTKEGVSYVVDTALDLLNKNPKCEEMLNKVLDRLAANTGVKPKYGTIRELLEQFRKEGTIYPVGAWNSSQAGGEFGGNAHIILAMSSDTNVTANRLLFELLHTAGGRNPNKPEGINSNYGDYQIYQAYNDLGVIMSVDEWMARADVKDYYANDPTGRRGFVAAALAGSAQDDACLGKPSPARPVK